MVFPAAGIAMGAGALGGLYGAKKDRDMAGRMKRAREKALKNMKRLWKHAYAQSQGEFNQARQDILGQGVSQMGQLTAGLGAGGLLNTTVAPNMARGVLSTTQQSLGQLGAQRAASEYGKWLDFAQIKGMTPYDNFSPQSSAEGWGQAGAGLGALGAGFGGMDWSSLFGGGGPSMEQMRKTAAEEGGMY